MAAVDVYRATPSSTGAREVPENDTEELQLSQEDMDVASLAANAVTPPVIASSVASTINSAPAYVSTTAGGERNQPHQVQVVDGSSGGGTGGTESGVLITEPVLGVRMLMSSRDVGSIIGKGGMTIKSFRETSGARINISNSTSSERLVTITGTRENIAKAFSAIGKKIEQVMKEAAAAKQLSQVEGQQQQPPAAPAPAQPASVGSGGSVGSGEGDPGNNHVSFRLVIQSSQCGSLIGKGGSKIKEIREGTGASIQVAGETLPNSTERAVTVSGTPDALTLCIGQICNIMLENPPRGPLIPYKPHALPNQAYQPRVNPNLPYQTPYTATFHTAAGPATTTQQMRIPNDLIGCVIGRKGSKIHEIRVSSGAQIKIAGNEGDNQDRLVTITGTPEAVGMAQYLINSRIHSEVNSFITIGMSLS